MPDLRAISERIELLLDASASGGVVARERAEELVRLVTDLYGGGLEQILDIFHEAGRLDEEMLDRLAADEFVAGLLIVHGLHPYSVETRVERALESVRPYLGSHGGDVELVAVEDESVHLRLLGSCDGCPSSSVTLKLAVEGAIEAAAPEISKIEVETPSTTSTPDGPLIPVDSLRSRLHDSEDGVAAWHPLPEVSALAPGDLSGALAGDTPLVVCRIGNDHFAFLDRCARCETGLRDAALTRRMGGAVGDAVLRCPTCGAHYDVRRAGACLDDPGLHLDPLPLLVDGETVSVATPVPVTS
ncbi:MAG: NifU family protein [Nocardioides sp.]|nr:NifU family protein [Nocardioides sp.]